MQGCSLSEHPQQQALGGRRRACKDIFQAPSWAKDCTPTFPSPSTSSSPKPQGALLGPFSSEKTGAKAGNSAEDLGMSWRGPEAGHRGRSEGELPFFLPRNRRSLARGKRPEP